MHALYCSSPDFSFKGVFAITRADHFHGNQSELVSFRGQQTLVGGAHVRHYVILISRESCSSREKSRVRPNGAIGEALHGPIGKSCNCDSGALVGGKVGG